MEQHVGYRVGVVERERERERERAVMHKDRSHVATGAKLCYCNVELCVVNKSLGQIKLPFICSSTADRNTPVLFTLYTSDFTYNTESCRIQKFSDDSAVVGCIRDGQEGEYRSLVGVSVWRWSTPTST